MDAKNDAVRQALEELSSFAPRMRRERMQKRLRPPAKEEPSAPEAKQDGPSAEEMEKLRTLYAGG